VSSAEPRLEPERVRKWTTELVDLVDVERVVTFHSGPGEALFGLIGRSFALFRSMVSCYDAGEPAANGLILRALFEDVVFGSLLVNGSGDDHNRLAGDYLHHRNRLLRAVDELPAGDDLFDSIEPKGWPLLDRARRADELVGNNDMQKLYQTVFRMESLMSTHAGFAPVLSHLEFDSTATVRSLLHQPQSPSLMAARLLSGGILFGNLAQLILEFGGVDVCEIRAHIETAPTE
jgi:hypothetical protein